MNSTDIIKLEYGTLLTLIEYINNKACYSEVEAAIETIQEEIDNIELTPGPPGPQGEVGPIGPPGPQGIPGPAGAPTFVSYTRVATDKPNKKLYFSSSFQIPTGTSSLYIFSITDTPSGTDLNSDVIIRTNMADIPILDYEGKPMTGKKISSGIPFIVYYDSSSTKIYFLNTKL